MYGMNRVFFILFLLLALLSISTHSQEQKAQEKIVWLYIPDGQLIDRPVRAYVFGIEDDKLVNPQLRLIRLKILTARERGEEDGKDEKKRRDINDLTEEDWIEKGLIKEPFDRAAGQQVERKVRGFWKRSSKNPIYDTGILLLFDLQDLDISPLLPGTRILPILYYGNDENRNRVLSDKEVYFCKREGTVFIVSIVIVPLILLLGFLAKKDYYLRGLLSTADGRMSVSLTQMFLWTVAVGAAVLALGITRLSVPEIPMNLVFLMGLSVTTSMVGHWQSDSVQQTKERRLDKDKIKENMRQRQERKPQLSDLVMIRVPGGEDADLVKAQLLFWTVITLTIFVVKSIVDGELWDVPEQLLMLMGISQAGFLTRKQFILNQEKKETKKVIDEKEAPKGAEKKATDENKAETKKKKAKGSVNKSPNDKDSKKSSE